MSQSKLPLLFAGALILSALLALRFLSPKYNIDVSELPVPDLRGPRPNALVIGTVGINVRKELEEFQPFVDHLALQLEGSGIREGAVVVAKSSVEMAKLMQLGHVDLYVDSPFPVFIVNELTGSEPIATRWKKGTEKYHSSIFVKKGSATASLKGLEGQVMALESPDSTSGYFLPKSVLLDEGLVMSLKGSANEAVAANEVGYYFTDDEERIMEDVEAGIAAAGGVNARELQEYSRLNNVEFDVLLETPEIYRHIVVARKRLRKSTRDAILEVLVEMHDDPDAKSVLAKFGRTSKFESFEGAPEKAYENIDRLVEQMMAEVTY